MPKPIRFPRILAAALILAAASASLSSCGASSLLKKEPSPTWTLLLTQTPTPTPSPSPTLPPTEWPVVFSETFDEANEAWQVGEMNNEYAKGTLAIVGGKYYIKLTAKKAFIWQCIAPMDDLLDAYVSVKVDQWDGSKTAEYGLILRDSDAGRYFFGITSLQMGYEFSKYSAGEWISLTLPTNSSQILVGEPNRIGVQALGPQFNFFINGEEVDDARDPSTAPGKAGVGIILYKAGDWIEITFDNFEVRSPE